MRQNVSCTILPGKKLDYSKHRRPRVSPTSQTCYIRLRITNEIKKYNNRKNHCKGLLIITCLNTVNNNINKIYAKHLVFNKEETCKHPSHVDVCDGCERTSAETLRRRYRQSEWRVGRSKCVVGIGTRVVRG